MILSAHVSCHLRAGVRGLGVVLLLAAFLFAQGCGKKIVGSAAPDGGYHKGYSVVSTARTQLGAPYKPGGTHPRAGFDCSGLIVWTYSQHGVQMPRLAKEQARIGKPVRFEHLEPGDIVVFKISSGYHTGICSGRGTFVHSPRAGRRVREESLGTPYWKDRFISGRRVF